MNIHMDWCKENEKGEIISVPKYIYNVCMFGEEEYN